jgi:hypothetical protein
MLLGHTFAAEGARTRATGTLRADRPIRAGQLLERDKRSTPRADGAAAFRLPRALEQEKLGAPGHLGRPSGDELNATWRAG